MPVTGGAGYREAMSSMPDHNESGHGHRVRPRLVWLALLVLVAGMVVVAAGMMVDVLAVILAGVVVFLAGLVMAWRSGFFYDVHTSSSMAAEVQDVVRDESHLGPDPSARVDPDAARDTPRGERDAR